MTLIGTTLATAAVVRIVVGSVLAGLRGRAFRRNPDTVP
jgi:hypothetical protein